jgi:L-amino acid N-acyltransferase YncA
MSLTIRDATMSDAEMICAIYNPIVLNTTISFEEDAVPVADMASRIESVTAKLPWLVGQEDGAVAGYAYASRHRERSAYRYSVETTAYVAEFARGRGIGTGLYTALLNRLRTLSVHAALGGIALPNPASIALHEKCGFKKVAHFEQVGLKFGRWVDVGYWQIVL